MRTWQMHELGDPWTDLQLDEAEAPTPGPGQIGIDVEAVGVAFPNVLMAQGKYQVKSTPPFSPAESVVGRVSSLGDGVDSFSIGDRVMTGDGVALAEHTVASAKRAFLAPESLTPGQSTALLVNYPTTLFGLYERAQLKEGETVFNFRLLFIFLMSIPSFEDFLSASICTSVRVHRAFIISISI